MAAGGDAVLAKPGITPSEWTSSLVLCPAVSWSHGGGNSYSGRAQAGYAYHVPTPAWAPLRPVNPFAGRTRGQTSSVR